MLHHLLYLSFRLKSSASVGLQIFFFIFHNDVFNFLRKPIKYRKEKKKHFVSSLGFASDGMFYGRVH